jgi:hypothetical protein
MNVKESDLVNKNEWLYRNITGKKGVPLSKIRKVKDDVQSYDISSIKKPLIEKDYLEKKLSSAKKRQQNIETMELIAKLQNFDAIEDIDADVKIEMINLLKLKYPKYAYLIKTDNDKLAMSRRRFSSISSTPFQKNNLLYKYNMDEKKEDNKNNITSSSTSTIKSDDRANLPLNQYSDNSEDEKEYLSLQKRYSCLVDPKLEIMEAKNKKNMVKKESEAIEKIIQVSNDLREWTNENLTKKDIEPLENYLERSGHNIFEGKKSYRLSLPSIFNSVEEKEEAENLTVDENGNTYFGNIQTKKKKNKKDKEFDILLNACRLMVLDSKPPMPIHVTEDHSIPYEYIEKITNNLGVDISKVKQAKNKTNYKKKRDENKKEKIRDDSNTKRFQYGDWYCSPAKWNVMRKRREQCRSIQKYPSSENWTKYMMFHKYLESPYSFDKENSDSSNENE